MEANQTLKTYLDNNFAVVSVDTRNKILVCTLKVEYVPINDFQALFAEISKIVKAEFIKKMVFDKRSLKIFHQPSMTWYHIIWKEEMYKLGLKTYRKLLPTDSIFRKSVEIGRSKIKLDNPQFDFAKFDIQYCETLEEALEK
ncbi:MAG: hypothetical protein MUE85_21250 [Microscillaceae bacterium]|jgi:hypothetical protein|nr:hypothetical protein [Microscillaceae bacterium]